MAATTDTMRVVVFLLLITLSYSLHDSLNLILNPGERSCFYEDLKAPSLTRVVDTFVELGWKRGIRLEIFGPLRKAEVIHEELGEPLQVSEIDIRLKRGNNGEEVENNGDGVGDNLSHTSKFTAPKEGTYAFCIDNRQGQVVPKLIEVRCGGVAFLLSSPCL